jgi:low affinity Fe/Cu permease
VTSECNDINTKCSVWYENNYNAAKLKKDNGEVLSWKDKIFCYADEWYVRIGITVLYFITVRLIQDIMNPGDDSEDDHLPMK